MFVMKDVKTIFMQIVKFICKIYFLKKKKLFSSLFRNALV
jgi:hypothetical protein